MGWGGVGWGGGVGGGGFWKWEGGDMSYVRLLTDDRLSHPTSFFFSTTMGQGSWSKYIYGRSRAIALMHNTAFYMVFYIGRFSEFSVFFRF